MLSSHYYPKNHFVPISLTAPSTPSAPVLLHYEIKMHLSLFPLLATLIAHSLTNPLPSDTFSHARQSCESDPSCSVHEDALTGIVDLIQPRAAIATKIDFADAKMSWGCNVDPIQTMGNLSSACPAGDASCPNGVFSIPIQSIQPPPSGSPPGASVNNPVPSTLDFAVTGSYPSSMRDGMLELVKVAAGQNIKWYRGVPWLTHVMRDTAVEAAPSSLMNQRGTCDIAVQSSGIDVTRWDGVGTSQITVKVVNSVMSSGFCSDFSSVGVGSAVMGMIPQVGGGLAAIFGVVTAGCAMAANS